MGKSLFIDQDLYEILIESESLEEPELLSESNSFSPFNICPEYERGIRDCQYNSVEYHFSGNAVNLLSNIQNQSYGASDR